MIYVKCQQDSFDKKKLLTQIYGERNIYGLFEKSTNDLLQDLKTRPYQDAALFYDTYSLQRNFYFHPNTPTQGEIVAILKNSLLNLQEFHYIERLQAGLELTNREKIYAEKHDFEADNLQMSNAKTVISKLLRESIRLTQKKEGNCLEAKEASFFQGKQLLFDSLQQISPKDRLSIFTALINFAIQQVPKQPTKYIREIYELYKLGF